MAQVSYIHSSVKKRKRKEKRNVSCDFVDAVVSNFATTGASLSPGLVFLIWLGNTRPGWVVPKMIPKHEIPS
jgi:hypothetical protein